MDTKRAEIRADAAGVAKAFSNTALGEPPLNAANRYLRSVVARPGNNRATVVEAVRLTAVASDTLLGLNAATGTATWPRSR